MFPYLQAKPAKSLEEEIDTKNRRIYAFRTAAVSFHNYLSRQNECFESVKPMSTNIEQDRNILNKTLKFRPKLKQYFFKKPQTTGDCYSTLLDCLDVLEEDHEYLLSNLERE